MPGTVSKQYARNDSTVTDSTRYEFNNLGQPVNIKQYAGTDRESKITFSNYDTYGIPGRISKSGKWGQNLAADSLWLEFGYTSCGRFMSSVKGPLNNNMYFSYNLSTGLLSSHTTVHDFTTNYTYGPFGSLQKRVSPDLKQSYTNLYWSEGHPDAPSGSLYYSWSKSSGNNEVIVFYDAAGRTLKRRREYASVVHNCL